MYDYDPYYDEVDLPDPGAGEAYGHAFKQLWPHFLTLLLVTIVGWILKAPGMMFEGVGDIGSHLLKEGSSDIASVFAVSMMSVGYMLAFAFAVLVVKPIEYGIEYCYARAARDDRIRSEDIFSGFGNYLSVVGANILVGFTVFLGFLMLVLPGIYFLCKFKFVPYLVIDRQMGAIDAMSKSWSMTNGHAIDVFLIWLFGIPIYFLGFLMLGIGVIPAGMLVNLAYASLYHAVDLEQDYDTIYV